MTTCFACHRPNQDPFALAIERAERERLKRIEHWAKFVVINFAAENDGNVRAGIKEIAEALTPSTAPAEEPGS